MITYHSDLILCYYCTICSLPFIMGSFLGLFCPLLIVLSTHTNNTLDVYKLGTYDLKYQALNSYNRVIASQSTCKSIKHQVSILPHWFTPSLLPLHLVGTSNSDRRHRSVSRRCNRGAGKIASHLWFQLVRRSRFPNNVTPV